MEKIIPTQTDLAEMTKAAKIIIDKDMLSREIVFETLERIAKEHKLKPIYLW